MVPGSPLSEPNCTLCLILASSTTWSATWVRMSCLTRGLKPFRSYFTTGTLYCRDTNSRVIRWSDEKTQWTGWGWEEDLSRLCSDSEIPSHLVKTLYLDALLFDCLQDALVNVLLTYRETQDPGIKQTIRTSCSVQSALIHTDQTTTSAEVHFISVITEKVQ